MRYGFAVTAITLLVGAETEAAIFSYKYTGGILDAGYNEFAQTVLGYNYTAKLVINEDKLGVSLKNSSLNFHFSYNGTADIGPVSGVTGFSFRIRPLPGTNDTYPSHVQRPVAGADLSIITDNNGNITRGCYDYLDGPPDGSFGCGTDLWSYAGSVYGPSGTWETTRVSTPVPIPATGFLLAFALAGVALVRKKSL